MPRETNRRQFMLHSAGVATAGSALGGVALGAADSPIAEGDASPYAAFPSADSEDVRQVVAFSHANIEGLAPLIEKQPELAKSSIDWGFGDWESALGAASHMGRRDIAALLMKHDARPTHFTFAMLGQVDVVRAFVEANPGVQRLRGPHGFTLLHHARIGGDEAVSVREYLESVGDADIRYTNEPLDESQQAALLGMYEFGSGEHDRFEVATNRRGQLSIRRTSARFGRSLFHQGALEFHPAGAEHARIQFETRGDSIVGLTLHMAGSIIEAQRA